MKTSLIISTYKSPHFLEKVMESVFRQRMMPDQIIVTEDGKFKDNSILIQKLRGRIKSTPLLHLQQEDIGNRKPLALNKAISQAVGDYLIFVDGDCVLRSDFISDHLEMANEKSFITGRRVELSPWASDFLTVDKIKQGYLDGVPWRVFFDSIFGETYHLGRMIKTPKVFRSLFERNHVFDIRGCNFSVHKKHMMAINGFDNSFSGAYGEDSDVEHRLKFLGLMMTSIKGAAIQYHLWHPTQVKDESNQVRLKKLLEEKVFRASSGLSEAIEIK